jgi:flagellar motor switch protein FliG
MSLASRGLPAGGGVGFELFDRQAPGQTDFMQRLSYQRALQGELARTIAELGGVDSARVHLALADHPDGTASDRRASASVVVKLARGARLAPAQIDGIVHLVAASVEGLLPDAVTVVDESGRVLAAAPRADESLGIESTAVGYQRAIERSAEERIESLLAPVVGAGKVVARVAATIDFARTERTEETYDPDKTVVRESSATRETGASASPRIDRPRREAVLRRVEDRVADRRAGRHGEGALGGGADRRQRIATRTAGACSCRAPDDEIERLKALVASAVGVSDARGDRLEVTSAPFQSPEPEPAQGFLAATPSWAPPLAARLVAVLFALGCAGARRAAGRRALGPRGRPRDPPRRARRRGGRARPRERHARAAEPRARRAARARMARREREGRVMTDGWSDTRDATPARTGVDKAAILLLTLGTEVASEILKHLSEDEVRRLSHAMARVRTIPAARPAAVHEEAWRWLSSRDGYLIDGEDFVRKTIVPARGAATLGSADSPARTIATRLDGRAARGDRQGAARRASTGRRARDRAPAAAAGGRGARAAAGGAADGHRPPHRGAARGAGRRARRRRQRDRRPGRSDSGASAAVGRADRRREAAADILNLVGHYAEERILATIEERSPQTADTIRSLMLTFDDLQRLDNRGMQTLLKEVGRDDLLLAMKTASPVMQERILGNLSLRAREIMQEDLVTLGPVRLRDVERAQAAIVLAARRLAEEQKIQLGLFTDDALV